MTDTIPDEWVEAAINAWLIGPWGGGTNDTMRGVLFAVRPMIEAQGRRKALEEAAEKIERWHDIIECADAIRADNGRKADMAMLSDLSDEIRALIDQPAPEAPFDLVLHLERQREFSRRTFGPEARTKGVLDHIRKELAEIETDPAEISEWVDVIILGFDGAWRAGWEPSDIVAAIVAKQTKNEARTWPDWRSAAPDKAIEHDRSKDAPDPRDAKIEKLRGLLEDARINGLTYWEPNTSRGYVAKTAMLDRIDAALKETGR